MAAGAGRRVGAWIMLAGAVAVVVGVVLANQVADAVERQMRDLDASESRAALALEKLATSGIVAALGIAIFLVGGLAFLIGSARARKRGTLVPQPSRALASVASIALVLVILLAILAPQGPVQRLTAAATQSGSAVRIELHQGNLTGIAAAPNPPEDVWSCHPPAARGSIALNFTSAGGPGAAYALAIVEAQQGDGSWKEIGRARGAHQFTQIAEQDFASDVRVRTRLDDGVIGTVQFGFCFSFAPYAS